MELNHKKILVTFLMHLGDLTLTTPFIRALREAAPDSHITMLVDEKLKDVVSVSYTHLDVYKRQMQRCVGAIKFYFAGTGAAPRTASIWLRNLWGVSKRSAADFRLLR